MKPAVAQANGRFQFDDVAALAKKNASEPFREPQPVPEFLTKLSYDEYRDIRFNTEHSWWRDGGNFQIQFIHPGLYYGNAIKINSIEGGTVRPALFSPQLFTYGRNKFADKIPAELGFAGFRITYPLSQKKDFNHVVVFAGASYFRAVAKGETFGLSARGLAIDTGLPWGEEFPAFKEFWLERPGPGARQMTLYALLDSQSLTGAYAFLIQPGERTIVTVQARLFQRKAVKELGIAPLTSMFFSGEEKPRPAEDWRPEVHDSDGLLLQSGAGDWLWRPLGNPEKLRISYFGTENPRGFGLLQRDRQFQNYQDLEARHELRPNAWITPIGNWGKGQVKLVEIPSKKESNDNIVAYWLPAATAPPGESFDIAYRMEFQSGEPADVKLARVNATRIGIGDKEEWKRFVVDFEGPSLKSLGESAPVKANVSVGADGQLVQQSVFRNPLNGSWRLSFQVKPPKGKPLELRAFLRNGNRTVSETWSYQIES